MTSTIITRSGQCLAAGALLVGIAFGADAIAGATPVNGYDGQAFYDCQHALNVKDPDFDYKYLKCCQDAGGVPTNNAGSLSCAQPEVMENPITQPPPPTKPGATAIRPPGRNSVG